MQFIFYVAVLVLIPLGCKTASEDSDTLSKDEPNAFVWKRLGSSYWAENCSDPRYPQNHPWDNQDTRELVGSQCFLPFERVSILVNSRQNHDCVEDFMYEDFQCWPLRIDDELFGMVGHHFTDNPDSRLCGGGVGDQGCVQEEIPFGDPKIIGTIWSVTADTTDRDFQAILEQAGYTLPEDRASYLLRALKYIQGKDNWHLLAGFVEAHAASEVVFKILKASGRDPGWKLDAFVWIQKKSTPAAFVEKFYSESE